MGAAHGLRARLRLPPRPVGVTTAPTRNRLSASMSPPAPSAMIPASWCWSKVKVDNCPPMPCSSNWPRTRLSRDEKAVTRLQNCLARRRHRHRRPALIFSPPTFPASPSTVRTRGNHRVPPMATFKLGWPTNRSPASTIDLGDKPGITVTAVSRNPSQAARLRARL